MLKAFGIFTLKVAAATFVIQIIDSWTGIFTQVRTMAAGLIPGRKA